MTNMNTTAARKATSTATRETAFPRNTAGMPKGHPSEATLFGIPAGSSREYCFSRGRARCLSFLVVFMFVMVYNRALAEGIAMTHKERRILLTMTALLLAAFRGRAAQRQCGRAQEPRKRPNVVFVLADQWRAQALGLAGRSKREDPEPKPPAREGVWFPSGFNRARLLPGPASCS